MDQDCEDVCCLTDKLSVQVLQAMIQMGVLVPTGDMTAVRRTALFFLNRLFNENWELIYTFLTQLSFNLTGDIF